MEPEHQLISDFFFSLEQELMLVFSLVKKEHIKHPNLHRHSAIHTKHIRIYSYTDPLQETAPPDSLQQHFSLRLILMRLRHAKHKNALYLDQVGNIQKPAVQIRLPESCDAYKLSSALFPLTPKGFGLAWYWRMAVYMCSRIMTLNRIITGEKILCHFCAKNRSYFGSISITDDTHLANICYNHTTRIWEAIKDFQTLLYRRP